MFFVLFFLVSVFINAKIETVILYINQYAPIDELTWYVHHTDDILTE